jgi:hypothetical protein
LSALLAGPGSIILLTLRPACPPQLRVTIARPLPGCNHTQLYSRFSDLKRFYAKFSMVFLQGREFHPFLSSMMPFANIADNSHF